MQAPRERLLYSGCSVLKGDINNSFDGLNCNTSEIASSAMNGYQGWEVHRGKTIIPVALSQIFFVHILKLKKMEEKHKIT